MPAALSRSPGLDQLHHEAGIGAAKAKRIVERGAHLPLLGGMRHQINAHTAVAGIVEVERRRHDLVAQGEDAEDRLHRTGAAQQMADGALGAAHRDIGQIVAKQAANRAQFQLVTHRGAGAMGVDVIDVSGGHAGLLQRHLHGTEGTRAFRMRRRHMIGIAREAITDHLGVDFRTARLGMLIFFQHHHAGALAHDKTVAVLVIRAAGAGWIVVKTGRERAGGGKAGNADGADGALGAAGQHDVGIIVADHAGGIANRVGAGGTGSHHRVIRPHQPVFDADLPRDQVDQTAMHEMRGNAVRALLGQHQRFALDTRQTADAAANGAAGAQTRDLIHFGKASVFQRLPGGINAKDDERVDLTLNLVVHPLVGVEAIFVVSRLHFASDVALVARGIEMRDLARARLAGKDIGPHGFNVGAQWRDHSKTRYNHTTHRKFSAVHPGDNPRQPKTIRPKTHRGQNTGRPQKHNRLSPKRTEPAEHLPHYRKAVPQES